MQRSITTSLRRAATASSARTAPARRHVAIAAVQSCAKRPYRPPQTSTRAFASSSVAHSDQPPQSYRIRSASIDSSQLFSSLPSNDPVCATYSQLTDREYHDVADRTMDRLTEYLEETIEAFDDQPYDVEYSVRSRPPPPSSSSSSLGAQREADTVQGFHVRQVGSVDRQVGRQRNLRPQQATAQQANLALEPHQVRAVRRLGQALTCSRSCVLSRARSRPSLESGVQDRSHRSLHRPQRSETVRLGLDAPRLVLPPRRRPLARPTESRTARVAPRRDDPSRFGGTGRRLSQRSGISPKTFCNAWDSCPFDSSFGRNNRDKKSVGRARPSLNLDDAQSRGSSTRLAPFFSLSRRLFPSSSSALSFSSSHHSPSDITAIASGRMSRNAVRLTQDELASLRAATTLSSSEARDLIDLASEPSSTIQRPGVSSDEVMARRLWQGELNAFARTLDDRQLAVDLTTAQREGRTLEAVKRRREAAANATKTAPAASTTTTRTTTTPTSPPIQPRPDAHRSQCVICLDSVDLTPVAFTAPCSHRFCQTCLEAYYLNAVKDESLFPPKCCGFTIHPLNSIGSISKSVREVTLSTTRRRRSTGPRTACTATSRSVRRFSEATLRNPRT